MRTIYRLTGSLLVVAAALAATACTLEKQEEPSSLIGPSGLRRTFAVTASPTVLPRDGASVSQIRVTARDEKGMPLAGETLRLLTTTGSLSATEVTTGGAGDATVMFTAPPLSEAVTNAVITATPTGPEFDAGIRTETVTIALTGPTHPAASFTFTPETPGQFDLVTFDGSGTTLSGSACNGKCSYFWEFGDGTTGSGQKVTHRYETQGVFVVTLTVESSGGVFNSTSQAVTVGAPQAITADISVSPTDPVVGDTVFVDGRGSTTPDGVAITSYVWDFGDGHSATGETATNVYTAARTYTIRLIITDARGRTATDTTTVSVDAITP
jgi:PKD repeat protein